MSIPGGTAETSEAHPSRELLIRENAELRRAVYELSVLNELSLEIGKSFDTDEIMSHTVKRSLQAVSGEQAVITLVDREQDSAGETLVRIVDTASQSEHFHLHEALIGWMQLKNRPLLANDPTSDDRLRNINLPRGIQSLLCVPLVSKAELIGVLTVYNSKRGGFTAEDQRLLAIIASQAAQIIENARLNAESRAFELVREEIRLAMQIQQELLPARPPALPGYDVAGISIPAQEVGGDYFDFIQLDADRWAVALGDVSGKGLPASLLMANLQATLRGQLLFSTSTGECLHRANRLLYASTAPEKFATLFCGILDLRDHKLNFTNAGHEYPFLFGKQALKRRLMTGGMMLGTLEDYPYEEDTVAIEVGDLLVIMSDGIKDAENSREVPFGEARLESLLQDHRDLKAAEIVELVVATVGRFCGEVPHTDDLTLVVVKRMD